MEKQKSQLLNSLGNIYDAAYSKIEELSDRNAVVSAILGGLWTYVYPRFEQLNEDEIRNRLKQVYINSCADLGVKADVAERAVNNSVAIIMNNAKEAQFNTNYSHAPVGLLGAPGQGKTFAFKSVAKHFAAAFNLNFVFSVNKMRELEASGANALDDVFFYYQQTPTDYISGITGVQGLDIRQGEARVMIGEIVRFAEKARAALVVFDDLPNFDRTVIASVQELLFGGDSVGRKFSVGLTGNMGALDGTHAEPLSSAVKSRIRMFYMGTTFEDVIEYLKRGLTSQKRVAGKLLEMFCEEYSIPKDTYVALYDPQSDVNDMTLVSPRNLTLAMDGIAASVIVSGSPDVEILNMLRYQFPKAFSNAIVDFYRGLYDGVTHVVRMLLSSDFSSPTLRGVLNQPSEQKKTAMLINALAVVLQRDTLNQLRGMITQNSGRNYVSAGALRDFLQNELFEKLLRLRLACHHMNVDPNTATLKTFWINEIFATYGRLYSKDEPETVLFDLDGFDNKELFDSSNEEDIERIIQNIRSVADSIYSEYKKINHNNAMLLDAKSFKNMASEIANECFSAREEVAAYTKPERAKRARAEQSVSRDMSM